MIDATGLVQTHRDPKNGAPRLAPAAPAEPGRTQNHWRSTPLPPLAPAISPPATSIPPHCVAVAPATPFNTVRVSSKYRCQNLPPCCTAVRLRMLIGHCPRSALLHRSVRIRGFVVAPTYCAPGNVYWLQQGDTAASAHSCINILQMVVAWCHRQQLQPPAAAGAASTRAASHVETQPVLCGSVRRGRRFTRQSGEDGIRPVLG